MIEDVDVMVTMKGNDEIAKVSRALVGMDVEDRVRDFVHHAKMNGEPVKTS